MKVIELLNKIANGEEVPKKIKYKSLECKYDEELEDYFAKDDYDNFENLFECLFEGGKLSEFGNDEIEIIEEDKKIEKLRLSAYAGGTLFDEQKHRNERDCEMVYKINEIIDHINKEND